MNSNILFPAVLMVASMLVGSTNAQTIHADNSLGITVTLPKNQPNQMDVWIYDSTTTLKINGKYYYTQGIGVVHSNQFTINGGDHKDEIKIYGVSFKAELNVYLNDGNDYLDCLLNRPMKAFGGNGNDEIWCGDQDDQVRGGGGDDEIHGRRGDDKIYGEWGKDNLFGDAGEDNLLGGWGQDNLFGGPDTDALIGNDFTYSLGHYYNIPEWNYWAVPLPDYENDQLHGGEGRDLFFGDIFYWTKYFVYQLDIDCYYIWPMSDAKKVVVDSDTHLDFDYYQDYTMDFVIPKLPVFHFHGLPTLFWN